MQLSHQGFIYRIVAGQSVVKTYYSEVNFVCLASKERHVAMKANFDRLLSHLV